MKQSCCDPARRSDELVDIEAILHGNFSGFLWQHLPS
jgi:hypothetical protein